MADKKKLRGRLEIAGDIFNVLNQTMTAAKQNKLLKPLFKEIRLAEQKVRRENEKVAKRISKKPQVCSPYEIFHNRGCGKCKACLDDSGERYYVKQPKFLKG